ncbi:MAG: hypothetical protein MZV63_37445 [Marinilabiliales bacterium]|nr:hypothetical protein [Marinilabiliales bacterium]
MLERLGADGHEAAAAPCRPRPARRKPARYPSRCRPWPRRRSSPRPAARLAPAGSRVQLEMDPELIPINRGAPVFVPAMSEGGAGRLRGAGPERRGAGALAGGQEGHRAAGALPGHGRLGRRVAQMLAHDSWR